MHLHMPVALLKKNAKKILEVTGMQDIFVWNPEDFFLINITS